MDTLARTDYTKTNKNYSHQFPCPLFWLFLYLTVPKWRSHLHGGRETIEHFVDHRYSLPLLVNVKLGKTMSLSMRAWNTFPLFSKCVRTKTNCVALYNGQNVNNFNSFISGHFCISWKKIQHKNLVGLGRVVRKVRQHPDDHDFERWQLWFAVDRERW
jgi:hypothetical protein